MHGLRDLRVIDFSTGIAGPYCTKLLAEAWDAGGGYYAIVNRHSGRALDVSGALPNDGQALIQFTSRGATNQQWQLVATDSGYHRIVSRMSGKVADVFDRGLENGAAIIQWPWGGGTNQQWLPTQVATIP